MRLRDDAAIALAAVLLLLLAAAASPSAAAESTWSWPVDGARVVLRPFIAPPTPYGAGHRGVDLLADGGILLAPADGVVRFSGMVAGRPVLSIDHGGGVISSAEPVASTLVDGRDPANFETAMRPNTKVVVDGAPAGTTPLVLRMKSSDTPIKIIGNNVAIVVTPNRDHTVNLVPRKKQP